MRRGGIGRFFKLVGWYISFFNLWAASVAMFFVYLLLYDRFRIYVEPYWPALPLGEEAWALLLKAAFSTFEPLVATVHLALIVALLFSFEEGEGLSYVRYAAGVSRAAAYAAKWLATLALFVTPLVCAKVLMALSWDTRAILLPGRHLVLLLAASLAAYASYLFPILSALAVAVRRPLYYLLIVFLELYVVEARWAPLSVNLFYMVSALFFGPQPTGLWQPGSPALGGFFGIERSMLLPRLAASLACAVLTLLWYRWRGEVKWR